jgi:hypothetical protein
MPYEPYSTAPPIFVGNNFPINVVERPQFERFCLEMHGRVRPYSPGTNEQFREFCYLDSRVLDNEEFDALEGRTKIRAAFR